MTTPFMRDFNRFSAFMKERRAANAQAQATRQAARYAKPDPVERAVQYYTQDASAYDKVSDVVNAGADKPGFMLDGAAPAKPAAAPRAPAAPPAKPAAAKAPTPAVRAADRAPPRKAPQRDRKAKPSDVPSPAEIKKDIDPALVPAVEGEALKDEAAEAAAQGKPDKAQSLMDRAAEAYRKALSAMPDDDPRRDALMSLAQFGANLASTSSPNFMQAVGQAAGPALAGYEKMRSASAERALAKARGAYDLEKEQVSIEQEMAMNDAKIAEIASTGALREEQIKALRIENQNAPLLLKAKLREIEANIVRSRASAAESYAGADLKRRTDPNSGGGDAGGFNPKRVTEYRNSLAGQYRALLTAAAAEVQPSKKAAIMQEAAAVKSQIDQIDTVGARMLGLPNLSGGAAPVSTPAARGGNSPFVTLGSRPA